MKKSIIERILIAMAAAAFAGLACADETVSYAGQQKREIKSLSQEDIQSYLSGKGMGLAKAAELNGYPGPSHVLAMADDLALTAEQKRQTNELFIDMNSRAITLGHSLVEEERKLDQAFADKSITSDMLQKSLGRIGMLQAQLRETHLEAHLKQASILTSVQISKYNSLRGYGQAAYSERHSGEHKGHVH